MYKCALRPPRAGGRAKAWRLAAALAVLGRHPLTTCRARVAQLRGKEQGSYE